MNIDYPFHLSGRGRTAVADDEEHIRDMIEQLLFTEAGERVNRPDFGSGLMKMMFAANNPEVATGLQFTLQAALNRWLGDLIEVRGLEVDSVDSMLQITIAYAVRRTDERRELSLVRGGLS